jgi:hypothetical protein
MACGNNSRSYMRTALLLLAVALDAIHQGNGKDQVRINGREACEISKQTFSQTGSKVFLPGVPSDAIYFLWGNLLQWELLPTGTSVMITMADIYRS